VNNETTNETVRTVTDADLRNELGARYDVLEPLISGGDIVAQWSKVKATVQKNGQGVAIFQDYIKLQANVVKDGDGKVISGAVNGAMALADGNNGVVVTHFNYGLDLGRRSDVRNRIMSAHEDPMKAIAKAAKDLAGVLGISEDAALQQVIAMKKAQDESTADEASATDNEDS
tara:strand:- start:2594 stop:3112 length:519 start_codon:yes stop_codon:yes gene_type:complete